MSHWIEQKPEELESLKEIVSGTEWEIDFGDDGPVELNHSDGSRISIIKITYTDGDDYFKLEHVNDTNPFGDSSDPQREERGTLEEVVKFARMTVDNNS